MDLVNEKFINQEYYIEKFVDIHKKGYFEGKEIIRPDEIYNVQFEKLIIMLRDKNISMDIYNRIINEYHIPEDKVELGLLKYK